MSEAEALKAQISKLDRKLTEQRQLIKRLRGQLLEAEATMRAAIRVSVHSDNLVRLYKSICDRLRDSTETRDA